MGSYVVLQAEDKVQAIVVRSRYQNKPVDFFTEDDNTLQMGMFTREAGYTVKPHYHSCSSPFVIDSMQEFVLVKSGQVKLRLFTKAGKPTHETILEAGDVVLIVDGGHSLEFLEKSTLLEVKQGPYARNLKVFLEGEKN